MKKALLTSLTIFIIMTGYAQTEKGGRFIGGQFNFYGSTNSSLDTLNKSDRNSLRF